jgi:4'-phosphopantetheinyl transferase
MNHFKIPEPGELHIYSVTSKGDENILSKYENERYASFSTKASGDIYLKGHSAARYLAANYTGKQPSDLKFEISPEGKPSFPCTPGLHFNLSHSGNSVFIAFSCDPVGLDIEKYSRKADFSKLAERYIQPHERELMDLSSKPESIAFLELWTAKEAMLKLLGIGIASGLDKSLILNENEGVFDETKVYFKRYIFGDFIGTLASFSKIHLVRDFTY